MKFYSLTLLILMTTALSGCGQPGPLYLPNKSTPVPVEPPAKSEPQNNQ